MRLPMVCGVVVAALLGAAGLGHAAVPDQLRTLAGVSSTFEPETFVVAAGQSHTTATEFVAGRKYEVAISGALTVTTTGAGGGSCSTDAFREVSCNPANKLGTRLSWGLSGADSGYPSPIYRLDWFTSAAAKPNEPTCTACPPPSADGRYVIVLDRVATGRMTFRAQPPPDSPLPAGDSVAGSFEVTITPQCGSASPARRVARAVAVNEVRAVAVQPGVEFHRAGAPEDEWCPVERDTVLQQGDEISCDPDGAVTLQFADNSTVVIRNTTQLKIASFFTEGGVVKTEILLKMGEVAAKVHKSEATKSDFRIKTPTDVSSVRGTVYSAFYDPGSGQTLWRVEQGVVAVGSGKAVQLVRAGFEALQPRSGKRVVGKAGTVGARGGLNVVTALRLVQKIVGRQNGPCGVSTPREKAFSVKPAPDGWTVSVKLLGTNAGTATWSVRRAKATPKNALSRRVTGGCKA